MRLYKIFIILSGFYFSTASAVQSSFTFTGNLTGVGNPVTSIQLTIYGTIPAPCNLYSQTYSNVPLDGAGNFSVNIDGLPAANFLNGTYTSLSQIFDTSNNNITGLALCSVDGTAASNEWRISVNVNGFTLSNYVPINAVPFALRAINTEKIGGQKVSSITPANLDLLQYSAGTWSPASTASLGLVSSSTSAGG